MKKNNLRKCSICKKEFDITNTEYLKKINFMEKECFISKHLSKGLGMDIINEKILLIENQMKIESELKKEQELAKERKALLTKKNDADSNRYKNELISYIRDLYNVSTIPNHFFIKLASINNGSYKGLEEGISYEDLLYIFKKKQKYFNTVYLRNYSKGKEIIGMSRVNYDLAIAISLYDEYKAWKRKQQILASDNIQEETAKGQNDNKEQIDFSKIKVDKCDDDDISDILDDLY